MKLRDALLLLKENVRPYLIFWDEWKTNENCNLSTEEICLIDRYVQAGYEPSLLDKLSMQDKVADIERVCTKLGIAQRVYKEWVVLRFLLTIITMAKEYGYDDFLNTPITHLRVEDEIKTLLKSFKVYTLQQLFIIYSAEDFGRAWLYKNINEFLVAVKKPATTTV